MADEGRFRALGREASWGSVELNMSFMALYASCVLMVTVGSSPDSGASGSAPEKAPPNRSKDVVSSPARPAPVCHLQAEEISRRSVLEKICQSSGRQPNRGHDANPDQTNFAQCRCSRLK